MCGVVGVISPEPVDPARMNRALAALESRGPDGEGAWWCPERRVGLGHRRLAINDPEGGAQPLVDERFVSTINGEFYGLPQQYRGRSDSLALADLLQERAPTKALAALNGEFAGLVFDRQTLTLWAFRDRFGVKPLFWGRRGVEIWFASKPSALWAAGLPGGWCESGFARAAATQYPLPGSTVFSGISAVKPGHLLEVKGTAISERRYWQVPTLQDGPSDPDTLLESLRKAVECRVRREHQTAVLLSGGIDSASVLALATRTGQNVKAYSVEFVDHRGTGFAEGGLAAEQAALCGVNHRVIDLTGREILQDLKTVTRDLQGHVVNGHAVAKWRLAQGIRADGCKVLLSGEGADELLFGYRHFAPYFGKPIDASDPAGAGILVTGEATPDLPNHWPHFFQSKFQLGQKIGSFLSLPLEPIVCFEKVLEGCKGATPLEIARLAWLQTALTSYILETLSDGAEMAHSVEGRPPFLDHTLWETVTAMRLGECDKRLLREAMGDLVVPSIRHKAKHPFMAGPLGLPLFEQLEAVIRDGSHPFVDRSRALTRLQHIRQLSPEQRLEWEPAALWLLSSYYLQEHWT